jgi:hypothetical protein
MKKLFLILCLSVAAINAMEQELIEQDLRALYSPQTIQKWKTQLNRINALLSEDLKARNTQDPEINVPLEQADEIMKQVRQDFDQWRKHENTPACKSILYSMEPQDKEAISSAFERIKQTFTMIELKYTVSLGKGLIKKRQRLSNQARYDEALRANILPIACIGAGCGLIIGALYTYATSQNQ